MSSIHEGKGFGRNLFSISNTKRGNLEVVLSQLMIGFLLNNNLAPIGSPVFSTCFLADLFEQRARNVPLASADVRGGGKLRDEPKERLRRRLQ